MVILRSANPELMTEEKRVPHKRRKRKGEHKIEKVMGEHKRGTLRSSSGEKVTKRSQALAIALSEARGAGAKIPKKRKKK